MFKYFLAVAFVCVASLNGMQQSVTQTVSQESSPNAASRTNSEKKTRAEAFLQKYAETGQMFNFEMELRLLLTEGSIFYKDFKIDVEWRRLATRVQRKQRLKEMLMAIARAWENCNALRERNFEAAAIEGARILWLSQEGTGIRPFSEDLLSVKDLDAYIEANFFI